MGLLQHKPAAFLVKPVLYLRQQGQKQIMLCLEMVMQIGRGHARLLRNQMHPGPADGIFGHHPEGRIQNTLFLQSTRHIVHPFLGKIYLLKIIERNGALCKAPVSPGSHSAFCIIFYPIFFSKIVN